MTSYRLRRIEHSVRWYGSAPERYSLDNFVHSLLAALGPPVMVQLGLDQWRHHSCGVAPPGTRIPVSIVEKSEAAHTRGTS